jgi:hypothetical protein
MPNSDAQPTPVMLNHLDLLLDMDLLEGEADWKVVEKLNAPPTASAHGKDENEDEDEDDDE